MTQTSIRTLETHDIPWPEVGPVGATMTALTMREFGEPEVLKLETVETPELRSGELLVKVAAISVGRLLDLLARSGRHPYASFTFPHILGGDHAGTVVRVADDVTNFRVGDHVAVFPVHYMGGDKYSATGYADVSPNIEIIGTHRPGADAEYSRVPASSASVVPDGVGPIQAASLASVGAVAAIQFSRAGGVGPDSRVIVQGATSGLGATTALLAKHLGAQVVVSSRDEAKRGKLRDLGFEHVFDATDDNFTQLARDAFGGEGATVVVDNLGEPTVWEHGFDALEPGGAMVSSGAFLGRTVPLNLQKLYTTGIRVIGARTGTPESITELWRQVGLGFRTVVDRTFPLVEAPAAHRYVEAGGNVGRVLLLP